MCRSWGHGFSHRACAGGHVLRELILLPHFIKSLRQVETLAQFGVIFLLFTLGLELSFSKLHYVQAVSLAGGSLEIWLMIFLCGVLADFIGAPLSEGIFIGAFLSMSSTAVVVQCIVERKFIRSSSGQITVGTLILQDCTIGLLFALLPILGGSHGILEGTVSLLRTATATIIFACAISICRTHVHAIFDLVSNSKHCRELHQMVRHSTIPVSPNVLFLSNIWQERM